MGSRLGLILPLSAAFLSGAFLSGPALAQTQQGPISLTPPPPARDAAPPSLAPSAAAAARSAVTRAPLAASLAAPSAALKAAAPRSLTSQTAAAKPAARGPGPETMRSGAVKPPATTGVPRTLIEALATTYSTQPALQAGRARLRATDENVPAALAGWRPQVQLSGGGGYGGGASQTYNRGTFLKTPTDRLIGTATGQITQNIYTGGRTQANINRSKNQVMAERANLILQEQTSFTAVVNAYVGVIQRTQELALNRNNETVLTKQLQATNDRFRVGEITRTDVAQAEAALAGARAQRETSEGTLETARGVFQQVVGVLPPADLVPPQPLALPVKTETEAIAMASSNNPQVVAALFTDAAAKDAVDVAFAQLMPTLSVQGQMFNQQNSAGFGTQNTGYQVVAQLTVPLYQGGSEYAGVRQARQQQQFTVRDLEDKRRTAVQNAVQAWETLASARAAAQSTRAQIRANEIALEGVEREAIVGSRTTLDVLNAQQQLLNSRTSLVQNLAQLVNASYAVAAAVGRLTARDMHLPVPLYDETAYYNAVRDKWVGLGDYATNQPGR